jgi:Terminase large subunit, T4likevirus-type, N-terminal/Terminase RNaseH-like domain
MSKELETAIIKAPYKRMSYTEEQILEIARCADPITGPQHFLDHYFFIQHPVKGAIQFHPFDYQERLIDSYHNYRFSISLMPRQTGKSTTAAGYLLWYAMFVPDSTILVAAHKYLGAQEIMQRVRYAYENCPDFIRAGVTSYNKGSLDFENGSRIVSQTTTENTGRGMSISLLYCDEFAFVRPTIASEFWTSITPTLATGGKCIITSTPNSDEDQFAQIWRGANKTIDINGNETELGINGFKAFRSRWEEHPERDESWAAQMRAQLGEERFRREMECEFIIYDETLISPLKLVELAGIDPIERQGQVRWYKKPAKDHTYFIALDPSLGTGGDPSAIQVFEMPGCKQVAEWCDNKTPVQRQARIVQEICSYISDIIGTQNNIYYSVENNTLGEAALVAIAEIGEENYKGIFLSEPARAGNVRRYRKGFNTSQKVKLTACSKLKSLVETNRMFLASKALVSELKTFVASGNSYAAKLGEHDDLVMSTILAIRMMQTLQNYDAALDAEIKDANEFIEPMPFIMI